MFVSRKLPTPLSCTDRLPVDPDPASPEVYGNFKNCHLEQWTMLDVTWQLMDYGLHTHISEIWFSSEQHEISMCLCNFPMALRGQEKNHRSNQSPKTAQIPIQTLSRQASVLTWAVKCNDCLGLYMKHSKFIKKRSLFRTDNIYWCTTWWRCPRKPSIAPLILHVLHLALDCADCFFFVTHVNHVFGILEVFACQFCSENSLHGPQQGLSLACQVVEDRWCSENDDFLMICPHFPRGISIYIQFDVRVVV